MLGAFAEPVLRNRMSFSMDSQKLQLPIRYVRRMSKGGMSKGGMSIGALTAARRLFSLSPKLMLFSTMFFISTYQLSAVFCVGVFCVAVTRGDEPAVAATPHSREMTARIDQLLHERLQEIGWLAAGPSTDASFLRRAMLDLTGHPPTGSEVLDFLEDRAEDKRQQLIERLLRSSNHASHWATIWATWLLPDATGPTFGQGPSGLRVWLRNRFQENLRYDRLVADLVVATGSSQSGPTKFFVAHEGKPEKLAAQTARVFMGVQLDCAECHDHPFDVWSQRDFWGFAAYFAQLSPNADQAMMGTVEVTDVEQGEVTLPGTAETILPRPLVADGLSGLNSGTRRQKLSLWLTAPENPFLARAAVNRVWATLMGRGLIEPIDDMRSLDIASHPQLLDELSRYFASTGYDLRDLVATIAHTRAYARSTRHPSGEVPEASYAAMTTKPLTETQLANSVAAIARQLSDNNQAVQTALSSQLGRLRGDASEAKLGIVSALVTLHGDIFDTVSREGTSRLLTALTAPHLDDAQRLRWLFLTVLNRPPTTDELQAFSELTSSPPAAPPGDESVGAAQQSVDASVPVAKNAEALLAQTAPPPWLSDLLWALLNSTEFAMTP